MGQDLAHRRIDTQLRPVATCRRVEVEAAACDQHEGAHRGIRLAHRVRHDDGVPCPPPGAAGIGPPTPQVDDPPPVVPGSDGRAGALAGHEQVAEDVPDGFEPRFHRPALRLVYYRRSLPGGGWETVTTCEVRSLARAASMTARARTASVGSTGIPAWGSGLARADATSR